MQKFCVHESFIVILITWLFGYMKYLHLTLKSYTMSIDRKYGRKIDYFGGNMNLTSHVLHGHNSLIRLNFRGYPFFHTDF